LVPFVGGGGSTLSSHRPHVDACASQGAAYGALSIPGLLPTGRTARLDGADGAGRTDPPARAAPSASAEKKRSCRVRPPSICWPIPCTTTIRATVPPREKPAFRAIYKSGRR